MQRELTATEPPRQGRRGRDRELSVRTYPQLAHLASGYFHQDYDLDAPTASGIIAGFLYGEEPGAIRELAAEIRSILDSGMTENQIGDLWITTLQASCEPANDGLTYRAWFTMPLNALERT
jgi:CdiI immunity protein